MQNRILSALSKSSQFVDKGGYPHISTTMSGQAIGTHGDLEHKDWLKGSVEMQTRTVSHSSARWTMCSLLVVLYGEA